MFSKIVVALDISPLSHQVFSQALDLAQSNGANLMLLHILSPASSDSPIYVPAEVDSFYPTATADPNLTLWRQRWNEFVETGEEILASFAKKATAAGIKVEFHQVSGTPAADICGLARNWQADLIVVGRGGKSGISELFLGSVSNWVMHHAPCSVLVVQDSN